MSTTTPPQPISFLKPLNYFQAHRPGKPRLKARLSTGQVVEVGAAEWRHRAMATLTKGK